MFKFDVIPCSGLMNIWKKKPTKLEIYGWCMF